MPRLIREEEFIDKIAAISDLRTLSLPTIGKVLKECFYSWCNEYKTYVMDDDFCSRGILKKEEHA